MELEAPVRGALLDCPRAAVLVDVRERVTRPDISGPGTVERAVVATSTGLAGVTGEGAAGVGLDVRGVT